MARPRSRSTPSSLVQLRAGLGDAVEITSQYGSRAPEIVQLRDRAVKRVRLQSGGLPAEIREITPASRELGRPGMAGSSSFRRSFTGPVISRTRTLGAVSRCGRGWNAAGHPLPPDFPRLACGLNPRMRNFILKLSLV